MINFDQPRLGKLVIRGMAIFSMINAIATLPACSPGETPPKTISSSPSNPTSSQASNLDTVSPSPPAIASSASVAKTSIPIPPLPPEAAPSIATPNSSIDYGGKTNRENWIVTDPDPQGLNCRWSSAMPKDWANPSAKFPRLNIQEWSVVRQFSKDTELKANNSPAGLITIADENGQPWLKVSIGENDQICFVRANSQFIQPK
jgi:hypothetical protein